jgi:hypothetical protein
MTGKKIHFEARVRTDMALRIPHIKRRVNEIQPGDWFKVTIEKIVPKKRNDE